MHDARIGDVVYVRPLCVTSLQYQTKNTSWRNRPAAAGNSRVKLRVVILPFLTTTKSSAVR